VNDKIPDPVDKVLDLGEYFMHNNVKFLELAAELPERMDLKEMDKLSIHSLFITTLHLANEKNYILNPCGPCDFEIFKIPKSMQTHN
jgi:hypothetical protein